MGSLGHNELGHDHGQERKLKKWSNHHFSDAGALPFYPWPWKVSWGTITDVCAKFEKNPSWAFWVNLFTSFIQRLANDQSQAGSTWNHNIPPGVDMRKFSLAQLQKIFNTDYIEGLVQGFRISIANTLEILQSFTKASIYDLKENFPQILDGSFTCPGLSASEICWPLSAEHSPILSILGIKLGIPQHFYKVSTMRPITETDNKQLTWHVCMLSFAAHGWSVRFVCGCECQRRSWELWKERNWKW